VKCLVVIAHPVADSLCHALARASLDALSAAGHEVAVEDLYQAEFSPALTVSERGTYYQPSFDSSAVRLQIERLLAADALVLVFPTWWFGFPAQGLVRPCLGTCAPACQFQMLSLYKAERLGARQVQLFCSRIEKAIAQWS